MSRSSITPAILTALLALGAPLSAADEHAGHNHAAEGAHAHGKAEAVGAVDISVYKVAVSASGAIAAGKEWHVELRLNPDQPVPKAIRVWVGTENGRGSVKAKAEAEKDAKGEYGAHVEVPNPIPADSKLWISIEPDNGQTAKGSVALPKTEATHEHKEGDGHKH
ncbi:MAG: hypothetical protein J0M02_00870 [Planctomycetes bacterium]|nr:hypothetical protein [Planctomycetota bacterium]